MVLIESVISGRLAHLIPLDEGLFLTQPLSTGTHIDHIGHAVFTKYYYRVGDIIMQPPQSKTIPLLWINFSLEEKYFVKCRAYRKLITAFSEVKSGKTQEKPVQATIVTLHGSGGSGRTQLARYYTFHPVQTYSHCLVFSCFFKGIG